MSVVGVSGNATANVADIIGGADQILRVNSAGDALAFGVIDLSKSGTVGSSVLGISNGGTSAATAAEAFNALAPITDLGDIIYGSAANESSRLPGNTSTTTMVLSQTGDGTNSAAPEWRYPDLSYVQNYLRENVPSIVPLLADIYSDALVSITLTPGIWMITSETTIMPDLTGIWSATVVLGTAANSAYTSGQSSAHDIITISLSTIAPIETTTTVSVFAAASVAATVVNTPPTNPSTPGTATAIHAIRIR